MQPVPFLPAGVLLKYIDKRAESQELQFPTPATYPKLCKAEIAPGAAASCDYFVPFRLTTWRPVAYDLGCIWRLGVAKSDYHER